MAAGNKKICYRCMKEIPEEPCPYCGFERQLYGVPQQHLKPGTILRGRYVLGIAVGSGGFGITYIARDRNLEMTVAVKELFLRKFCTRSSDGRVLTASEQRACFLETKKQFLQEARVLAKFQGDSYRAMVTVREYFEERDTAYLVMDYLEGKTLRELVREQRCKLPDLVELLTPVAEILTEIHRYHIVHRDVSPDNILIQEDGRAYLLDFGGAAQLGGEEISPVLSFKQGYTPPEQFAAGAHLGSWTDVYALGATVLFCLTGERPEEAALSGTNREHLPENLQRVLARAMEPEVVRRYQTVEEFWRELKKLCRRKISRPAAAAAGAAVLTCLALAAVFLLSGIRKEDPYVWTEGVYVLSCAENPEFHLGIEGGFCDNESSAALKTGEIKNSDRLMVKSPTEPSWAVFSFLHTGSYLQQDAGSPSLVQMEESFAEPLSFRGSVLGETEQGEEILALETEDHRWLSPENPPVLTEKMPETGWIFTPTQEGSGESRLPVWHTGEKETGMAGLWQLRSVLDDRCLTAVPSLMEEPPTLCLLPETSDGGRVFVFAEQENGVYTLRADPERVGPEGMLKLEPEEDQLYFGSVKTGSPEKFRLKYAGKNTWFLEISDGRRLSAQKDSEELKLLFPSRESEGESSEMRWYLEVPESQ